MSIHVALNHVTHYSYDRLVNLGPQVIRLRPCPHSRTRILSYTQRVVRRAKLQRQGEPWQTLVGSQANVGLVNLGREPFTVRRGDRIAQMVLAPVFRATLALRGSLEETARGSGGFGSTGLR